MIEILTALSDAVSFESFVRLIEIGILVYMIRILKVVSDQTRDLHVWHNRESADDPGRMIWWENPKHLITLQAMEAHLEKIANRGE